MIINALTFDSTNPKPVRLTIPLYKRSPNFGKNKTMIVQKERKVDNNWVQ